MTLDEKIVTSSLCALLLSDLAIDIIGIKSVAANSIANIIAAFFISGHLDFDFII